ncbi:hypothetical protein BDQ17DRAFT_1339296 [Cyathus striatus]|nr:hypothetical protein BDQ17DRAFT_1339296 [Cyathus striatus]
MTSIPDHIFTTLERRLSGAKNPYRLTYDSDDVETRNVFKRLPKRWLDMTAVMDMRPCDVADLAGEKGVNVSGCNGWISEMTLVHEIRKHENEMGDDSSSDDDDEDYPMEFCGWTLPSNRRLSCTVASIACA